MQISVLNKLICNLKDGIYILNLILNFKLGESPF